jgi:hypothetical protein
VNEDEILNGVENELAGLDAAVPEMPTLNLSLSLSDEDLEGSETLYTHIPAGKRTDFRVYSITPQPHFDKKNNRPAVRWDIVLEAVSDEWGPGKKVRDRLRFTPQEAFRWGPFLKAIGAVEGPGAVDMTLFNGERHTEFEDAVVSAKVLGYTWKNVQGEYCRSHGNGRKEVPRDGTAYFEELGYYQKAEGPSEPQGESDGLTEFDPTNYM